MKSGNETLRFIYQTQGVCPPEIHFQIQEEVLEDVRFVGGGCPGNAQLVSRLLKGKPVRDVVGFLKEITCRNDTSCPDQLSKALTAVEEGALEPARSFKVHTDVQPWKRIGWIGNLEGHTDILERLTLRMREKEVETIYCLGNLTGNSSSNKDLIAFMRKEGILSIQGELDFQYAFGEEPEEFPPLEQKDRDYLVRLPQVLSFRIGGEKGMAFFGKYVQDFPGFSDFDPFALEMNMVCDLTHFLQDETVFPALASMVPQFDAQVILFSQIKEWGHWQKEGIDFISVGPAFDDKKLTWGLLESLGSGIHFRVIREENPDGG